LFYCRTIRNAHFVDENTQKKERPGTGFHRPLLITKIAGKFVEKAKVGYVEHHIIEKLDMWNII